MPQTFQSPKPSGPTPSSALKSGRMRSCKRRDSRQSSVRTKQTNLRRLHCCWIGRELSRLGVFPDILLDRPQFLLLSLTALLGPLLATLGLAFFHGRAWPPRLAPWQRRRPERRVSRAPEAARGPPLRA